MMGVIEGCLIEEFHLLIFKIVYTFTIVALGMCISIFLHGNFNSCLNSCLSVNLAMGERLLQHFNLTLGHSGVDLLQFLGGESGCIIFLEDYQVLRLCVLVSCIR